MATEDVVRRWSHESQNTFLKKRKRFRILLIFVWIVALNYSILITGDEKYEFLIKYIFKIEFRNIVEISCSYMFS